VAGRAGTGNADELDPESAACRRDFGAATDGTDSLTGFALGTDPRHPNRLRASGCSDFPDFLVDDIDVSDPECKTAI
jgi:hypothetical protein